MCRRSSTNRKRACKEARGAVGAKKAAAESAPAPAVADRISYNARTRKSVQGAGELLDALASNELKLESIDPKRLPPEFQKLTREELEKRIAKTRQERTVVQKEIDELTKKRNAYLETENKRLAAAGNGDSFDEKVAQTIRAQAEKKGINYTR